MASEVRIGVVGLGYWGKKVAREYHQLLKSNIIEDLVLCDVVKEEITTVKQECQDSSTVDNYKQMFEHVDGVHICTPNATHYKIAMDFLSHDVNVLVEKPMTMNYQEARRLAYYAYNRNLVLAVGHIFRFCNAVRKAKEMYESGALGKLYFAKLQWTNLVPSPTERDVIFDLAPHPVDIINFITSKWPTRIACMGRAFRRHEFEETAYINAEFEDFIANIEVSWVFPKKVRNISMVGSKKFISVEAVEQKIKIYDMERSLWSDIAVERNNTILDECMHFVRAIKNKSTPINDGFNAAENVKVLEACQTSMKEHNTVSILW